MDTFFIEFSSGEAIWFRPELLKYFTTLHEERKKQKKKSDTFRFPGDYKRYVRMWQLTFLIYREHDELYGNTKGLNMPLRSEMMDRTLKMIELIEMYDLIHVLYVTGATLLLIEVVKELVTRLLPMRASQLYILHPNAEKMEDEEAMKRVKETAEDPLHQINMPYYAKLAHLENIFNTYLGFTELVKGVIDLMPQTKSISACGATHSLIITPSGLYACGDNTDGKLGIEPEILKYANSPKKVPISEEYEVIAVKCSANHTLILTTNGLYACGSNASGQLALGPHASNIAMIGTPQRVPIDNVIEFACSDVHSLFLTLGGRVYGAGSNRYGQLGLGEELFDHQFSSFCIFYSPMRIPFYKIHTFTALACGARHSLFLTSDGYLYACGDNEYGQCGSEASSEALKNPTEVDAFIPEEDEEEGNIVQTIACGDLHSVVLNRRGVAFSFGDNGYAQLGLGDKKTRDLPRRIKLKATKKKRTDEEEEEEGMEVEVSATSIKASAIYCGSFYTMILGRDGLLYAFGDNKDHTQLGVGDTGTDVQYPTVVNKISNVISVSCGSAHTMILAFDGLYVCGNAGKAMGLGTNTKHAVPVQLLSFHEEGKASSIAQNKRKKFVLKSLLFHPSTLYNEKEVEEI